MVPGRFTEKARAIINHATEEAVRFKHREIGTEHLLLGLIREGQGIAVKALKDIGVSLEELEREVRRVLKEGDAASDESGRPPTFTRAATQVIQYAAEEAKRLGYNSIGTEHILMGLVRDRNSAAAKILDSFGVTLDRVNEAISPIHSTLPGEGLPKPDGFRDGLKDATKFIQESLDRAGRMGRESFLPPGRYRLDGSLTVPPGVTFSGAWTLPHHARLRTGTVLLAYGGRSQEDGPPLISLSPSAAVKGLTVFYPEQSIDDVQPYPWTIRGGGMHNSVIDVTLVNPYRAIDVGSSHNELHYLRNIFGCPLKVGIYINNCTDIGRIENVHFNPHYWSRDEGDGEQRPSMEKLINYLLTEGEAFVFGRTDWEYVLNTFCV